MEKSIKRYMPIFVLPTFFAFILGFIVPFIMGIWLSFCKFNNRNRREIRRIFKLHRSTERYGIPSFILVYRTVRDCISSDH